MDFIDFITNKAKWWQEIKSLEQENYRISKQIEELRERQSDISAKIIIKIDLIQRVAEKYDEQMLNEENN